MAPSRVEEERLTQGLLDAACSGDLRRMKEFAERLDHGRGLVETYYRYRSSEGDTALIVGAARGRTNICKYLIEVVGLDVNVQDSNGDTVLMFACMSRNHQTVAYLVKKGAIVNLPNHDGYTALHTAARRGLKEILLLLISNGADVEALCQGCTPLCNAVSKGQTEAVKILLDYNANPNATSANVVSPLMLSISVGSRECINLLLKAGADPDLALNGITPLDMAVKMQDTEAIKCLLKAGANPNVTNVEGMTPLEISALNHYQKGVKVLLPKTNPIPSIRVWTHRGIISAVHSQEAIYQREQKKKDIIMESKTKGAEALKKKDYSAALHWYDMAIYCDPQDATMFYNRSLCWACLGQGTNALADAEDCIALKPDWSKAYYRKGVACEILKNFSGAVEAYGVALKLEPGNKEIQTAFRKALERL